MSQDPPPKQDDLAREIRAHLDLETEERVAEGASSDVARSAAHRAFGNITRIREDARAVWIRPWVEQAGQDGRYALRTLLRNPVFALVAVLTLALGIGATTAIFTVVNAILLRPLPFPESDRVVRFFESLPPPTGSSGVPRRTSPLTFAELATLESQTTTLSHVGMHIPTIRTLTNRDEPVRLIGVRVTPALLSMTGVSPALGRVFDAHEDAPGAEPVVILSYQSWQRYFSGDPDIIGRRLDLDGAAHTVVGVMRRGFAFLDPRDEFWMPLTRSGPFMKQGLPITARLADGASAAAALAEIKTIVQGLRGNPANRVDSSERFEVVRLFDLVVAPVRLPLIVLAAAVGLVLLIACANVANLLLARGATRHREMAVRLALGAGRGRLIRQAMAESVLLALAGGVAGIGLAVGGVQLLRALVTNLPRRDLGPGLGLPRLDEVAVDEFVFMVSLGVSVVTGIIFGVIPALRHSRPSAASTLREGPTSVSSGFNLLRGNRLQGALVIAEIAMAMTLLTGGTLLIHSFVKLANVNPGYDPTAVLTFQIALPPGRPDGELRAVAQGVVDRLRTLPSVRAAGYAESLPMTRVSARFSLLRTTPEMPASRRPPGGTFTPQSPDTRLVSREFLAALRIPVIAGRSFGDDDRSGQPQVMLINRTLANSGLLGQNPLGKQVYALGTEPWEVVGIVEDVRQSSLTEPVAPQIFIDYRQVARDEPMTGVGLYFAIRTEGDPASLVSSVRDIARQLDSRTMVENIAPMVQLVSNSIARPRAYAVLLGVFAAVAVFLAAGGIYSVMAYLVTQRTREIGIRMALGAGRPRVLALVLGQSFVVTIAGVAVGIGGAAALTRYLEQLLFGLTAVDPMTFVAAALLFSVIATLAAYAPARRATRVDPLIALRSE